MSFILDALRKSDQQRQRGATPTLTAAQMPAVEQRQPALLWYGLIAVGLVGAGILIGWLHRSTPEATASAPSAGKPAEATLQQVLPSSAEAPRHMDTPAAPSQVSGAMPAPIAAAARPTTAVVPPAPGAAGVVPAVKEPAIPKPVEPGPVVDASRESIVMQQSELPPAIQQEIPKLSILAHSYSSKPKARFVFINDRMVHEDDYPVPGLKLEQITPDGMVFSYKGYRFRRAANAD